MYSSYKFVIVSNRIVQNTLQATADCIMNDMFRIRNVKHNFRNGSSFRTRNVDSVNFGSEKVDDD